MGVSVGIATRPWPSLGKQPLPSKEQLLEKLTSLRRSRRKKETFRSFSNGFSHERRLIRGKVRKGKEKGVVVLNEAIFLSLFPEDNVSSEWRERIAALFCTARSSASLISHSSGRSMAICVSMLEWREREVGRLLKVARAVVG